MILKKMEVDKPTDVAIPIKYGMNIFNGKTVFTKISWIQNV